MKKLLSIILSVGTIIAINGCGGGGGGSTSNEITHNGYTYKSVKSPTTGRIWLDRNIGAAEVCTSYNDVACYGDYFQWGRNADGHEDSNSGTTPTQATSISNVGHSFFIVTTSANKYDWAYNVDSSGSARSMQWSKIDGSSVCPKGYRVPTYNELAQEVNGHIHNRDDAFNSFLKLPSAGYRNTNGTFAYVGVGGAYWSSDYASAYGAKAGVFNQNSAQGVTDAKRGYGVSVRCIKN